MNLYSLWAVLNYAGITVTLDDLRRREYRQLYHHYYWVIEQKKLEKKASEKANGNTNLAE